MNTLTIQEVRLMLTAATAEMGDKELIVTRAADSLNATPGDHGALLSYLNRLIDRKFLCFSKADGGALPVLVITAKGMSELKAFRQRARELEFEMIAV